MFKHERINNNLNLVHYGYYTQVYSYETLVAFISPSIFYKDSTKYSRTTSKHISIMMQNRQSRPVIEVTSVELNEIVKEQIHDSYRRRVYDEGNNS